MCPDTRPPAVAGRGSARGAGAEEGRGRRGFPRGGGAARILLFLAGVDPARRASALFDGPPPGAPGWTPSACPWDACPSRGGVPFRWRRHGFFRRAAAPRRVRRYRCLVCGRTFSDQTFAGTYYAKRPDILAPLANALVNGAALRQAARGLACARSTAVRAADRLGRLAALAWAKLLEGLAVAGPVVHDDFVGFALRRPLAVFVGTTVDPATDLVLALSAAPGIQGGRRTPAQRRRLAALRAALPRAARPRAFRALLAGLLGRLPPGARLALRTDDDRVFRDAVRRAGAGRVDHEVHPAPRRGRAAPGYNRALGPANALHRFLRHADAEHRRSPLAFARRVASVAGRAALFAFWRSFLQRRREGRNRGPTPAMLAGLADRELSWADLLGRRVFRREIARLPEAAARVLARDFPTPGAADSPRLHPRHWLALA